MTIDHLILYPKKLWSVIKFNDRYDSQTVCWFCVFSIFMLQFFFPFFKKYFCMILFSLFPTNLDLMYLVLTPIRKYI